MVQKIFSASALSLILSAFAGNATAQNLVDVSIDLVKVKKDRVAVTIVPPAISTSTATFLIPKTVPGTYSEDDYGRFVEDITALDANGNKLTVMKIDANSYSIENAQQLKKITYFVNDTYDTEKGDGFGKSDIFSPAGTNILAGKNYMLNTHGFVGYFKGYEHTPYKLTVTHSKKLTGVSAMNDLDASATQDVFEMPSYAKLVEMPIMYSKPNFTSFTVDGMEIIISVYSPNGKLKVDQIAASMEKVMRAQKHFLGTFNATKKYAVLIYLSNGKDSDAKGFGALEHPTSTTVVMPESMGVAALEEQLKDVVSHEFFHIVTPLTIHAEQIHNFDFNNPQMSEHLWMYEGVTEYFANLFQITEGLITESEFYERMTEKIENAKQMNDSMSFTYMSSHVFEKMYEEQYLNVYQKGALIAMCIDIIIREHSNGERGIIDMMQGLSAAYGSEKAFNDNELFAKITELTYPEVGEFLKKYVEGDTPIPYDQYFARMGVVKATIEVDGNPFLKGILSGDVKPYIGVYPSKEIFVLPEGNIFFKTLGIRSKDIIQEVNGKKYTYANINDLVAKSFEWKNGDEITMTILRDGKSMEVKGKVALPKEETEGYTSSDSDAAKTTLRNAWLKGK